MTRGIFSGGAVAAALCLWQVTGSAAADVLAGWSFNGLPAPVAPQIGAQHGTGNIDLAAFNGAGLSWQTGSDLNLFPADAAGESLNFGGTGANGKSAIISTSAVGFADLKLTMAVRATSTGHVSSVIEAFDGELWNLVGGFSLTPSTWAVATFDLASLDYLENQPAFLRLRLEGATSGAGSFRIDNVQIEGTAVPAPASIALAGAALACIRRRRR